MTKEEILQLIKEKGLHNAFNVKLNAGDLDETLNEEHFYGNVINYENESIVIKSHNEFKDIPFDIDYEGDEYCAHVTGEIDVILDCRLTDDEIIVSIEKDKFFLDDDEILVDIEEYKRFNAKVSFTLSDYIDDEGLSDYDLNVNSFIQRKVEKTIGDLLNEKGHYMGSSDDFRQFGTLVSIILTLK